MISEKASGNLSRVTACECVGEHVKRNGLVRKAVHVLQESDLHCRQG